MMTRSVKSGGGGHNLDFTVSGNIRYDNIGTVMDHDRGMSISSDESFFVKESKGGCYM